VKKKIYLFFFKKKRNKEMALELEFLRNGRLVFKTNDDELEIVDIKHPRDHWRCQIAGCGRVATQRFTKYAEWRPFLFCYDHYPFVRCYGQEKPERRKKSEAERLKEWSMKK
jgi:hypothetical protein